MHCVARTREGTTCKCKATRTINKAGGLDLCELHDELFHDVEQRHGTETAISRMRDGGNFKYAIH